LRAWDEGRGKALAVQPDKILSPDDPCFDIKKQHLDPAKGYAKTLTASHGYELMAMKAQFATLICKKPQGGQGLVFLPIGFDFIAIRTGSRIVDLENQLVLILLAGPFNDHGVASALKDFDQRLDIGTGR
jgi:hypothetical protein